MVDNQHQKISGYRDMPQDDIDMINAIKGVEIKVAALLAELDLRGSNPRDLAIARHHSEDLFYRAVKSVAKPASPYESALERTN